MPFDQSRTIVHTVTVGSVSFAQPGPKAMHNASTAQEVQIISPLASNFEFRVNTSSCYHSSGSADSFPLRQGTIRLLCPRATSPPISPGLLASLSHLSELRNPFLLTTFFPTGLGVIHIKPPNRLGPFSS